jgi:ribulose kinase
MPWCKTSDVESVDEDDIVTADECRVTCEACKNFLRLGSQLRGAVSAGMNAELEAKAAAVRSTLDATMEPEAPAPRVDWFGED